MFGRADRFSRLLGRRGAEGGATVACAAAAPLVVLAFAVAADYAKVCHFRSRAQLAADAASVAAAEAIARRPDSTNDSNDLARQIAASIFAGSAPRGTGTPTVDVRSHGVSVTVTVGYAGVAPSNFGSAFDYDAVSVDASSTSLLRIAEFRSTFAR
jgi:Flp pilus assembly protein TadG